MLKTDYPPDVRATTEYEVEVIPVIDGVQYPLQVYETVKAIDWTVPEQGIDANVDVTVTFNYNDVKILLLYIEIYPVVDKMLKSVPE